MITLGKNPNKIIKACLQNRLFLLISPLRRQKPKSQAEIRTRQTSGFFMSKI
uniref:Uncharacterized protein n=1 Tax=Myoviridae sp. ctKZW4 TaxID=2826639 RepID=A0A8S5NCA3_9CAUD|nr:MAG TPA: hypothetical protein [Myoviridae sp. ctKZW4]